MFRLMRNRLMAPDDGAAGGGTGPTEAPLAGNEGTPPKEEGDEPFAVFNDKAAFEERMQRHTRSQLKDIFGTSDKEKLRGMWDNYQQLQKDDDERRRAEMSEIERHKEDAEKARAEAESAREEAEQVRFESHVARICASKGIKNIEYATFAVAQAAEGVAEGEQLDVREFLAEKLQDETFKAAFQVEGPPVSRQTPITTTPVEGGAPPKPPAAGGGAPPVEDATKMSGPEFRQHLARLGVGQPGM